MNKSIFKLATLPALLFSFTAFAATPIDLSRQPASFLKTQSLTSTALNIVETDRSTDFNGTLHIRIKQTYKGHPVWGGDGVVHVPHANRATSSLIHLLTSNATMNGTLYQHIDKDLANVSSVVFTQEQSQKAIQQAITTYQQKRGAKPELSDIKAQLLVYIDEAHKAYWAYQISFNAAPMRIGDMPEKPVMMMDALTFQLYGQWDDIQTLDNTQGGGFGGNKKMGKLVYDGLTNSLPILNIQRDASTNLCYLQNKDVMVLDKSKNSKPMTFPCNTINPEHGNIYWNADHDAVNGAYSPSNDALYAGAVIKNMYHDWYHLDVLTKPNSKEPMQLVMVVHEVGLENAYWDGKQMTFGDGGSRLYPLTSLGVAAHEISHGFTQQHSNLLYAWQSGGMNESFSDMAAQAAEYYSTGKNSWLIGPEIMKADGDVIRYMDKPSKDCNGWTPGWFCSIDSADQYGWGLLLNVHQSSGVYNHFFYLLGTTKGWDTRKAFDVMVQANAHYWTPLSSFESAACGVITATKDYGYDLDAVRSAFKKVAIDTSNCA